MLPADLFTLPHWPSHAPQAQLHAHCTRVPPSLPPSLSLPPPSPPPFPPPVCTTLSFSGSSAFTRLTRKFDVVVVDEAAQAVEPATLVPLAHGGAKQVFLVGDPVQLPATVMSQVGCGRGGQGGREGGVGWRLRMLCVCVCAPGGGGMLKLVAWLRRLGLGLPPCLGTPACTPQR